MAKINGEDGNGYIGKSISDYLEQNGFNAAHLAVEVNEQILAKADYDTHIIADGDIIEVVNFVGGG